ncbi:hypothetical protein CONCODRAFT_5516 [Conidiobolus coronatus NRRL 28638]|uniref:Uncharacterized protein n=1 Tax=Conidiobolus coronatus (strain ATCC 28846 / CBS 209.66 / NRRL 28638) TaxID=796925 RepID=A0A137P9Y4_CONC2|nr:hypothetical protein CONCODRAFT_5516 [Conidiobolus coronatus NRRL 28638]|eukprot:KXN71803.1 hypothetical protein CONCODRAFT_5516 [Conidiobolus coronatus NRRL 28638]
MCLNEEKAYNKLKKYIFEKINPKTLKKAMEELVVNHLAKAKPNLEEVIAGIENKNISWIIAYFWHKIPAETEDLAAAISSYTHHVHGICYPDYKYNPKKRILSNQSKLLKN